MHITPNSTNGRGINIHRVNQRKKLVTEEEKKMEIYSRSLLLKEKGPVCTDKAQKYKCWLERRGLYGMYKIQRKNFKRVLMVNE